MKKGKRRKKPKVLSRDDRANITLHVLKQLRPQFRARENLFSGMDAADLLEEVGVHVWIALIRYRKKPYDDAVKLAMRSAVNRLTSMVRTQLTVVKRGAGAEHISIEKERETRGHHNNDRLNLTSSSIHLNGVRVVDALEAICSAAIIRVGVPKANALVRSLLYDWRSRNLSEHQKEIMQVMNRDRKTMRRLVSGFTKELRGQTQPNEYIRQENIIQKIDGRWKARGG